MTLFKFLRILILFSIFLALAFGAKREKLKSRSWAEPLDVVIYPLNGDNHSPVVDDYIETLDDPVFAPIDRFLQQQSEGYELITDRPARVRLGATLDELPPVAPKPDAGYPAIVWWGIQFRYWVYRHTPDDGADIRVLTLYHEAKQGRRLEHSLGLDKGLVAVVHAFAHDEQQAQNNIVITHELLHTVGARDKYDADNRAVFPMGYADPEQSPLYPQSQAEIMVGRIPLSETETRMAENLDECVIGEETAREINWLRDEP